MTHVPVAVVTGGASGFGAALAGELARRGFAVGLLDIDGDRVAAAARDLAAAHGKPVVGHRVDVATDADLEAAARAVGAELGRCDLLWANVGVQHFGTVESMTDDVWRWMLDVNVVGAARTLRAFLPLLRASAPSRVAFTASANVLAPAARLGGYQATKFALVGLAETLRFELAPDDIGVSVVYPSGMLTRHLESSALARPTDLGPGTFDEADIVAMMESRPALAEDLTTAEDAAARSIDAVLAGAPHVITHAALAAAFAEHRGEIDAALARVAAAG